MTRSRRFVRQSGVAIITLLSVACGPKLVPLPAPAPAADTPLPAVVVPAVRSRLTIPAVVPETRYRVQTVAQIERDSLGRKDVQRFTSQAQVLLQLRRSADGAFRASGRILGYAITPSLSPKPVALDSVRFDAVLNGFMLRVASQPPLANECDRPETGALTLVRDLLVRVPSTVSTGDRWRDSTVHIVCRSGVPMTVRTANDYVVAEITGRDADTRVVIRRTSTTRLEGKTSTAWRAVEVAGTGTGTLDAEVLVGSGAVQRVTGTSEMLLSVTDNGAPAGFRVQRVIQRVTVTGEVVPR